MNDPYFEIGGFRIAPSPCLPLIQDLVKTLTGLSPIAVDIGAADGLAFSNTLFLYMNRWQGLAIEADPKAFATLERFYRQYLPQVHLDCLRITPANVCERLQRHGIPHSFGFLSLDIDSYDRDVLAAVLQTYRPSLICAEINEKIPPPIRFWVPYRPDHVYAGDHFYGMSLSALADLAAAYDYDLVRLWFNNAFLVARERNPLPVQTSQQAFDTGCRIFKIPAYNLDMVPLLSLSPADGIRFLQRHFIQYAGRYELSLEAG